MLSSSFSQECLTLWFLCTQTPGMLVTSGSCLRLAACVSLLCWVGVVWFSRCDSMTVVEENACMLSAKSKRQCSHGPFGQAWRDSSRSCLLCVTWVVTDLWLQNRNGGIFCGGIPPGSQRVVSRGAAQKREICTSGNIGFHVCKAKTKLCT